MNAMSSTAALLASPPPTPTGLQASPTFAAAPPPPVVVPVNSDITAVAPRAYLPPHIVVLVHGNNGAPADFDYVEAALLRKFGAAQVLTIKSAMNHTQTALGIEIGGTRLAEEIYQTIFAYELHPDVDTYKLSIVAHSLGGLYARYAIVQLQAALAPLNVVYTSFVTLCTPHLGSRRPRGDSTLKNVWRMGVHTVLGSRTLYGQTGIDLLVDTSTTKRVTLSPGDSSSSDDEYTDSNAPPLLASMANADCPFIAALQQFQHGTLVALTDGDVVVPYASASIRNFNPYPSNALTERYSDWRWHLHHAGFVTGDGLTDREAALLQQLNAYVKDPYTTLPDAAQGVDVAASQRFASVDGYDADNKQEVEFAYDMITNLQRAMHWRRIDLTVEPAGVKGKLRLHDWPINKMQASSDCKATEFIDLLCEMIGCDHRMERLVENEIERATVQERLDVGVGFNRMLERFQQRRSASGSASQPSSDDDGGNGSSDGRTLSPTAATTATASPLLQRFWSRAPSPRARTRSALSPDASPPPLRRHSVDANEQQSQSLTSRYGIGAGLTQLYDTLQKRVTSSWNNTQQQTTPHPDATDAAIEAEIATLSTALGDDDAVDQKDDDDEEEHSTTR